MDIAEEAKWVYLLCWHTSRALVERGLPPIDTWKEAVRLLTEFDDEPPCMTDEEVDAAYRELMRRMGR